MKNIELKPSMFERDKIIDGYNWRDWTGNVWKIPVARKYSEANGEIIGASSLPSYLDMSDSGNWVTGGIQTKFQRLWEVACNCVDNRFAAREAARVKNETGYTYSVGDLTEICDVVIGTNYRLSSREMAIMNLLSDESAVEIMHYVTDEPGLESLQKKILQDVGIT